MKSVNEMSEVELVAAARAKAKAWALEDLRFFLKTWADAHNPRIEVDHAHQRQAIRDIIKDLAD